MKHLISVLLVLSLFVPWYTVNADEEVHGEAVLGGEIIHREGDDVSTDFVQEPFIPDFVDKKPIGRDDRVSVNEMEYPFCAIAYIECHAKCGCDSSGTGFLVGPSGLMTAGHVVYCVEHHQPADWFTIYFGYKSSRNYLYKYTKPTTFWYNYSTDYYGEEYDYAYIKLQERVGDRVGWFGINPMSDSQLNGTVLNAAGYRDGKLKYDYDLVYVSTSYMVNHTIDTEPGYSGCPIYTNDHYAVALNTSHDLVLDYNYGCRITGWLIEMMRNEGIFD